MSKVYQSLCGYDAIILDVPVDAAGAQTLAKLRSCFATWLAKNYPSVKMRDVRLIVAAHYFCIVPLHDNLHHQRQFLAKARWLLEADDDAAGRARTRSWLWPRRCSMSKSRGTMLVERGLARARETVEGAMSRGVIDASYFVLLLDISV